jgi:IS30 family transposase
VYRAWGVGPGPRNIDATGTRRRIEALATVGWSATAIADRLGVTKAAVRQLTLRHRVTVEKAAAIAAVYDELWDKKPPARNKPERISVAKTRGNALRMGLHPPLSWNDEDIDDPLAVPYIEPEPVKKRGIKKRANVEDIEWLASCSLSAPQIAARLAVSVYALEMECRRQDRNDLWLSLAAKERVAA